MERIFRPTSCEDTNLGIELQSMDLEMGMDSMFWPASKSAALYGFEFCFPIKKEEFLMVLKHQSFSES